MKIPLLIPFSVLSFKEFLQAISASFLFLFASLLYTFGEILAELGEVLTEIGNFLQKEG